MKSRRLYLLYITVVSVLTLNMFGCAPLPAPDKTAALVLKAPPATPTATANVNEISRVTYDPAPELWARSSPDGTQLLFSTYDTTKKGNEGWSIVLIDIGKAGRKLLSGSYSVIPAWYPDGKNFIYVYGKMQKSILVKSLIGSTAMTFISPSALGNEDGQPDVSHNGKKIALQTKLGDTYYVCTVNADGSNLTVYTEGKSPRWHPDDTKIAFYRSVGEKEQCFILDMETGQVTQLTPSDASNNNPVWSPDGKWLAFTSDRDGKYHIYAMKSEGSQVTQLTRGETREYFPHWSHDGYIYFSSDAGAQTALSDDPWTWTYSDIWRLKPKLSE